MKKTNVLEIIHGIHFGGAEKVVLQISTLSDRKKINIATVCLADGILFNKLKEENIDAHLIEMKSKYDLFVIPKIIKLVKEEKINVIHTHTGRTNFIGRIAAKLTGIKHITTIHSPIILDVNDGVSPQKTNAFVEKVTAFLSDYFVCVSEEGKQRLVENNVNKNKVCTIYNGAQVAKKEISEKEIIDFKKEFNIENDEYIVSMVASLRPRKGPEYFLKAIPLIKNEIKNVKFLIVGSAEFVESRDYLAELKELSKSVGILVDKELIFTGFRNDIDIILEASDLIILPSIFGEGLPLTLLEAMAHKTAIITTDAEGNREVVKDGVNGFLVPPKDEKAIAEKTVKLLKDENLRNTFAENGFQIVNSKYTIENMIKGYEEIFERISASS